MPMYTLNRNYTHRSLRGHIVNFTKGVAVYVPPMIETEVVSIGAEPVEGERMAVVVDEIEGKPAAAPEGEDRDQIIVKAFATLEARNDRNDFNGSGRPNLRSLKELCGFVVEARECDRLWVQYRERDEQK